MKLWKSFKADFKNEHGNIKWKIGEWQHQEGKVSLCNNGFHASKRAIDAMQFVNCEILAKVDVRGKSLTGEDKQCWSDMRILKAYKWQKEDSVALAIYAAELVIDIFEKQYPNDDRPRKAIEAAKQWLKNPSDKNAAYAAAYAARAAARAAYAAARAAADAEKILDKCEAFIQKRIKTLEEIK